MAQGITLDAFYAQTLYGSYGNPPPVLVRNKGRFIGQCVSGIRQFIVSVLDLPDQRVGDAYMYWDSPYMEKYFVKVTDGSRKDGDVLIWGDDPGSFTGKEGHIAIWYTGRIYNQNYNGSLKFTLNDFFTPGYLGAYRLKGETMNQQAVEKLVSMSYRAATDIDPTNEQAAYWVQRIREDNNRAYELASALGGSTYQGDPAFRSKARNYDTDVKAAYDKGLAQGGGEYEEVTTYRRVS